MVLHSTCKDRNTGAEILSQQLRTYGILVPGKEMLAINVDDVGRQ